MLLLLLLLLLVLSLSLSVSVVSSGGPALGLFTLSIVMVAKSNLDKGDLNEDGHNGVPLLRDGQRVVNDPLAANLVNAFQVSVH